jgi:RHS repeat-associated protein
LLVTPSPSDYDLAGNELAGYTLGYDAKNRVVSAAAGIGHTVAYGYDGDGRRVTKTMDPNTQSAATTYYVYDAFGQLAAEYGAPGAGVQFAGCATCYLFGDHLGSTRAIWDSGGVKGRLDYFPFGEPMPSGLSGRVTATCATGVTACYPANGDPTQRIGVAQEFTSKERDAETGLDFFGARYFSGAQGRFTSPDEPLIDQHASDPQSWNMYSYVRNNPLRFTDAFGRDCQDPTNADPCFTATSHASAFGRFFSSVGSFLKGSGQEATVNTFIDFTNVIDRMRQISYGGPDFRQPRLESTTTAGQYGQYAGMIAPFLIPGFGEADSLRVLGEVERLSLVKPNVTNPKLAELVEELFQGTDKVAGGTGGAVRYERMTGDLLSPAGHAQDARELVIRLDRFLKNNPGISLNDQSVTKGLILDLQNALGGK